MMLDKGMTDWMSTVATSKWMLIALIVLIVIVIVIMTLKKKGRLSVQIQPQKNEPVKSMPDWCWALYSRLIKLILMS